MHENAVDAALDATPAALEEARASALRTTADVFVQMTTESAKPVCSLYSRRNVVASTCATFSWPPDSGMCTSTIMMV